MKLQEFIAEMKVHRYNSTEKELVFDVMIEDKPITFRGPPMDDDTAYMALRHFADWARDYERIRRKLSEVYDGMKKVKKVVDGFFEE